MLFFTHWFDCAHFSKNECLGIDWMALSLMSRTNTFSLLHCGAPQTVHTEDSHVGVYMEEEGVGMRLQVGRVLGRRQVPMDRFPN